MRIYIVLLLILMVAVEVALAEPQLMAEKVISREMVVSPQGEVVKASTYVTLTIEGEGEADLIDKTAFIQPSIETHSIRPSEVSVDGELVEVQWRSLKVSDRLVVKYTAPLVKIPVKMSFKLFVNGKKVSLKYSDGFYLVEASKGDVIVYRLVVENCFTVNGAKPLLLVLVTWSIDSTKFSVINCSPAPAIVTELGETRMYTWSTMLNDSLVIEMTFKVRKTSMWGDACITSPQVNVVLDTSSMLKNIEETISQLENSLKMLDLIDNLTKNTISGLKLMSAILKNLSNSLETYAELLEVCANKSSEASKSLAEGAQISYEFSEKLKELSRTINKLIEIRNKLEYYIEFFKIGNSYSNEIENLLNNIKENSSAIPPSLNEITEEIKTILNEVDLTKEDLQETIIEIKELIDNLDKIAQGVSESIKLVEELGENLEISAEYMAQLAQGLRNASEYAKEMALNATEQAEELDSKIVLIKENLSELSKARKSLEKRLESLKRQYSALLKLNKVYLSEKPLIKCGVEAEGKILADIVEIKTFNIMVKEPRSSSIQLELNTGKKSIGFNYYLLILLAAIAPLALLAKAGLKNIRKESYRELVEEIDEITERIERLKSCLGIGEENE